MAYKGNPGAANLAKVLSDRINKQTQTPLAIDYGVILDEYKLLTNAFPVPIPKGDYTVCRHIMGVYMIDTLPIDHNHEGVHGPTSTITHKHPINYPKLKIGDRVLVVWIQNEPCVIDIIMSSENL